MNIALSSVRAACLSATLTACVTHEALALPSIEYLSVDPPPSGEWIIGATTGAPGGATVRIRFDAVVTEQSCSNYRTFGWMVRDQCQNYFSPRKVTGSTFSVSATCRGPTPENPVTTGKIDLFLDAARNANGAPLVLCAEDSSGQMAKIAYRVSYGQPVKEVKVSKNVTYSNKTGVLRVQGNVVPKGNTNLNGTVVQVTDTLGTQLGTGVVFKKKFDIKVPIDTPPKSVIVKVINTVSSVKPVKVNN
jgi:hypothetical protein